MPSTGTASPRVQERVLRALAAFHRQGIAAPKAAALAKRAGLHPRTVYRALESLQDAGRIRRVERWEIVEVTHANARDTARR